LCTTPHLLFFLKFEIYELYVWGEHTADVGRNLELYVLLYVGTVPRVRFDNIGTEQETQ
jgi:hypothetical protein